MHLWNPCCLLQGNRKAATLCLGARWQLHTSKYAWMSLVASQKAEPSVSAAAVDVYLASK